MNYSSKVDEYNEQVHGIEKKDYSEVMERLGTINRRFREKSPSQIPGTLSISTRH